MSLGYNEMDVVDEKGGGGGVVNRVLFDLVLETQVGDCFWAGKNLINLSLNLVEVLVSGC